MSYQKEQFDKNEKTIQKEMNGCDHQDINDVRQSCHQAWATDSEALEIIKAKKKEIAGRATPEEITEAFKNFRL